MKPAGRAVGHRLTRRQDIRDLEHRIRQRRERVVAALSTMAGGVRHRLMSPATLVAGVLLGAALHRSQQLRAFRLLALLQTANAGLRLLMSMTPGTSSAPGAARPGRPGSTAHGIPIPREELD